ncbi:chitin deacetylase [Coprinopsis marcescibilis]|uniref:Chitin deacetylase n=1 Tax=Coprinopsis marcescibilis TaxID=230819 RepID=A0A5C3L6X8_COPMA|nr:chitin deacetylase [Coprinopsis marcescibilis]
MFPSCSTLVAVIIAVTQASAAVIRNVNASVPLGKRQAPGEVILSCTEPNTVALTFDDGPYIWTQELVDMLDAADAKGTFYFRGCIYDEDNVERVQYAFERGHQIASHTWSHAHLPTLTIPELHREFWLLQEAVLKITGAYLVHTRPPFGEYNADVLHVAGLHGQTITYWDFDSLDTIMSPQQSTGSYQALIGQRPPSILTLNHEITESTVKVLMPAVIRAVQSAGYRMVTVAECLGVEPYLWIGEPEDRDESWTCADK